MRPAEAGVVGSPPIVTVSERTEEQAKYEKMWARDEYRLVAPGEHAVELFLAQANPKHQSEVIDFGSGTGRAGLALAQHGLQVQMVDFASNSLDADVRKHLSSALKFKQHDLTQPLNVAARYGFCTDVMEHIPPGEVELVLRNILGAAQHVFFQISCEDDVCGKLIGQPLHLSVHDHGWWLAKFQELEATVHWSQDCGSHCFFYVTAWWDGQKVSDSGQLNIDDASIIANVKANIPHWQQVKPHVTNDADVMILGGGPSLAGHLETIREYRANGVKLVTLNGAYNWCLERGLKPSAQVMVDARPFNARFTRPVIEDCKYLIASQCDPSVLEGLPKDRTYLWHTSWADIQDALKAQYGECYPVPGGQTVLLRAIPLLRMLGFKRFHLFGCDSCLTGDAHHTYAQAENDASPVIPVTVGDRVFQCHPWMVAQAQGFMDVIKFLQDEIEIEVHGDGLLSYIVEYGASLYDADCFLK